MTTYTYPGGELGLFAHAQNWKRYYGQMIRPFLGKRVLEVGAGLGATAQTLCRPDHEIWVCLEPDENLYQQLQQTIRSRQLPAFFRGFHGTVVDLPFHECFDAILYIDVLEHIEQDIQEIQRVLEHLRPDGFLIILAPAHQFLYSPFDRAIGHHRRYSLHSLAHAVPTHLKCHVLRYLDSVGFLASLGNRFLLRQAMPELRQILLWDKLMVRASLLLDPLLHYRVGKSVLGIWRKET
jgi:SAM-dependent methyltransferase